MAKVRRVWEIECCERDDIEYIKTALLHSGAYDIVDTQWDGQDGSTARIVYEIEESKIELMMRRIEENYL